jgi:hypothetical protein
MIKPIKGAGSLIDEFNKKLLEKGVEKGVNINELPAKL